MSEDKMREEHWRQWGIAGMPKDKIRLAEETWKAATESCAAIKDAEIAARDLMIKERDEALEGLMRVESRGRIMPIGKEWDAARKALAESEHHDSRTLEKMLLEARIDELEDFGQATGFGSAKLLAMIARNKSNLAELNKE